MTYTQSELTVILKGDSLSDDQIFKYKTELIHILKENIGNSDILEPEIKKKPGTKGDPFAIGTIILQWISDGTITGLLKSLNGILVREKSLVIDVKRGKEHIIINAKNINENKTMEFLEKVLSK